MVRTFLVTANAGSVFENMEEGLPIWLNEFASVVRSRDPEFVAIHFQETGGKSCENAYDLIETFFSRLVDRMEQLNFRVGEAFVDTRYDLEDQFTALSSIYFVHESLRLPVYIWDFQDAKFHEVHFLTSSLLTSKRHLNIHMGPSLDQTHRKQKEKFPKHFYPNCKWSRKGFLRTRWRFGKTVVDFVNIHLFHDSCNLMAASSFPSQFAQLREKTLKYTVDRIQSDGLEKSPLFIFGDFNFRINGKGVMDILKKECNNSEIVFETKRFHCPEQERRFKLSYEWLKQYDFETKPFGDLLHEQDLNFHPTYPFEEDISEAEKFMKTRLPAWCDRILFTPSTNDIFVKDFPTDYSLIGSNVCMGDHKPVGLLLKLRTDDFQPASINCNKEAGSNPATESIIGGKLVLMSENEIDALPKFPVMALASPTMKTIPDCTISFQEKDNNFSSRCWQNGSNENVDKIFGGGDIVDFSSVSNKNESIETNIDSTSDTGCTCFTGICRFRGRKRFFRQSTKVNNGGSGNQRSKALIGFRALSQCNKGFCSRSGSLLEPIATADPFCSCSSLPSSGLPSQRPSVTSVPTTPTLTREDINGKCQVVRVLNSENFPNLSTAPPTSLLASTDNAKLGRDFYWRCASCCETSGGPQPPTAAQFSPVVSEITKNNMNGATTILGCNGGNCPNRLIVMNLTSMINTATTDIKTNGEIPLSNTSNLSLIAINSKNDMEKQGFDRIVINEGCGETNGKIPICWATFNNMNCCPECVTLTNAPNKNLKMQNGEKCNKKQAKGKNGFAINNRNRSASQASATGFHTCKCHFKEGTRNATATGGCVSCSKCVIL